MGFYDYGHSKGNENLMTLADRRRLEQEKKAQAAQYANVNALRMKRATRDAAEARRDAEDEKHGAFTKFFRRVKRGEYGKAMKPLEDKAASIAGTLVEKAAISAGSDALGMDGGAKSPELAGGASAPGAPGSVPTAGGSALKYGTQAAVSGFQPGGLGGGQQLQPPPGYRIDPITGQLVPV